jgi:DNA-directed RNA polymerase subunit RPC12/RpoP
MPQMPCVLCGKQLDKRIDRNGKPYFHCDPCGTQFFIRRRQGIDNLNELIRTLRGRDLPFHEHAQMLYEIEGTLAEIRGLKKQLKALDSGFNLFSNDKDKQRVRKALRARIDRLLSDLEQIARGGRL